MFMEKRLIRRGLMMRMGVLGRAIDDRPVAPVVVLLPEINF
jgi:hypothetical protein